MINPLDAPIISNSLSYNSDTHLLFNEDTQNLEIFWRYVNLSENKAIIYFKKSQNGIIWSEKKIFLITKNKKKENNATILFIIKR